MRNASWYKSKWTTLNGWALALLVGGALLIACQPDDEIESTAGPGGSADLCPPVPGAGTPYALEVPYFFPEPVLPDFNPLTEEGVELGRYLFWEPRLSRNNAISCASCHLPEAAFSDNATFSTGLYGEQTARNSMALVNLAWNKDFFWDGRALSLEEQILEPIEHPVEMDMTWAEAVERIGSFPEYQELFTAAFGTPCVDSVRISYAMAQFIRTMISARSKFDRAYRYGEVQLTASELRGLELFLSEAGDPEIFPGGQGGGDCFHCHGGGLTEFTDHQFHNNGLDSVFTDIGRAAVTGFTFDEGLFKTPTLRNIGLSGPYMHDGRFATIRDVVEHYNFGGHASATIDPLMKMQGIGLGLTEQDVDDLVNFLNTLTDYEFVQDESFSNPH